MHTPKIDFLKPQNNDSKLLIPRTKGVLRNRFFILLFFVFAVGGIFAIRQVKINGENADEPQKKFSFLGSMRALISGGEKQIKGEKDGRINILLLGIGGEGHDGANLTDTIILTSINTKTKQVGMLGIPRDLLAPIPGYGYRKINNAYAFAEEVSAGTGGLNAKKVVGDVFGINVHYFVTVDFEGFRQMIDDLGGVTVDVEKSFTDSFYPTDDFKTRVVSFNAGRQTMNGEEALHFARSRHGNNGEGSDFARVKRQQKIIMAARDKMLSLGVLVNPAKMMRIYQTVSEHISTNIETWEILRLASLLRDVRGNEIARQTLELVPEGPLIPSMVNGAFVLLPESGSWDELRAAAQNIFTVREQAKISKKITVEIQNGTAIPGYAAKVAEMLRQQGYQVLKVSNAKSKDYEKTVIFGSDGSDQRQEDIIKIRGLLNANVAPAVLLPTSSTNTDMGAQKSAADFLIILGMLSLAVLEK